MSGDGRSRRVAVRGRSGRGADRGGGADGSVAADSNGSSLALVLRRRPSRRPFWREAPRCPAHRHARRQEARPGRAPNVVIEYSSLGCSHCADFHTQSLPTLKSQYSTRASRRSCTAISARCTSRRGAMVARCAGGDRYFTVLDVIFRRSRPGRGRRTPGARCSRCSATPARAVAHRRVPGDRRARGRRQCIRQEGRHVRHQRDADVHRERQQDRGQRAALRDHGLLQMITCGSTLKGRPPR